MKVLKPKELLKMLNQRDDVFCHVSTYIHKDTIFKPRIPFGLDMYGHNENDTIDRVCVSSSLEGALRAIPRGGLRIFDWYEDNALYFKVFIVDTLELNIKEESIYTPKYLKEKGYVHDSELTNEHWILKPFTTPESHTFLININDYEYDENKDFKNIKLSTDFLSKNEIAELKLEYLEYANEGIFSLAEEKEKLKKEYLKTNPDIEFLDKNKDEMIIIRAKKDQSIRDLMLFDSRYKSNAYLNNCW